MTFLDWAESGFMGGGFTAEQAESWGKFDADHGYAGAICDLGHVSKIVTAMGGVTGVVTYAADIGKNYAKGFPAGTFSVEFSNEDADSAQGKQAAEIQNGLLSQIGALTPFFDAEPSYGTPSGTLSMVQSYTEYTSAGLIGDLGYYANYGWDCDNLEQLIDAMGGTGNQTIQVYYSGNPGNYVSCGLTDFLGVHGAHVSSQDALGYQGAINAFKSAFGVCPQYVLISGGAANSFDATTLTCS